MKIIKKVFAFLFVLSLLSFFPQLSYSIDCSEYGLLNVYTDNMLFKQNSVAVLSGRIKPGAFVSAVLYDKDDCVISEDTVQADRGGRFCNSLKTPEGSFKNYRIVLYCNNEIIDSLNDVVFGELWLAGGQSNMQYPLLQADKGIDMYKNGITGSEWIRFLSTPDIPEYNGDPLKYPAEPLDEINGCFWHKASDNNIYKNSAVGYFFADEMLKKLNVPIGIIDSNLGGSSIASWLSRDAIDSDDDVKKTFIDSGEYLSRETWAETGHDSYLDMTVNYNKKIHPLRFFKLSGMIWYQGETDFIYDWSEYRYGLCLDLMQRSYSELFNYDGTIPIVLTQIAPFLYGRMHRMAQWNSALCDFQSKLPESRAVITNYDIDLEFSDEVGSIHPSHKYEIGQRMADSAYRMVYSDNEEIYTAASIGDYKIENNSVIINIDNAGSGVEISGKTPNGFSICGNDGVFTAAKAQIIDKDTIRVYSEKVTDPAAAAYAYCENNHYANLYSTDKNGLYMPVSPFITDKTKLKSSWGGNEWTECENNSFFHLGEDGKNYDLWQIKNAVISFDEMSSYDGENGLHIIKDKKCIFNSFFVNPVLYRSIKNKKHSFEEWNTDWSDYKSLSFMVRNNGNQSVKFKSAKIVNNSKTGYSPAVSGTTSVQTIIPADGNWHEITLDLNRLYLACNDSSAYYSNKKIDNVTDFVLEFNSKEADISIDTFRFCSEEFDKDSKITFSADYRNINGIFTFLIALITNFIGLFVK